MAKAIFPTDAVAFANLLDTLPVVAGGVVSKPLVHTEACKVVAFAMDAGQSISEHHAPFVATVQVLDGELRFGVAGEQRQMRANDWLIMPPDEKHDLEAITPTRFLLTLIK